MHGVKTPEVVSLGPFEVHRLIGFPVVGLLKTLVGANARLGNGPKALDTHGCAVDIDPTNLAALFRLGGVDHLHGLFDPSRTKPGVLTVDHQKALVPLIGQGNHLFFDLIKL